MLLEDQSNRPNCMTTHENEIIEVRSHSYFEYTLISFENLTPALFTTLFSLMQHAF